MESLISPMLATRLQKEPEEVHRLLDLVDRRKHTDSLELSAHGLTTILAGVFFYLTLSCKLG